MKKLFFLLLLLMLAMFSFAQQKTITGTVTGKSDKAPLVGVSIQSKNKTVLTDVSGKFSIEASAGDNLLFSYVGMKSVAVRITGNTQTMSVEMEEGVNELEQVVVTGYKSEKKVDLTGAVSVVNLSTIKNSPTTSPMLALQGQVPGLYIQTDGSPTGANGAPPRILIRGVNTLGSTNPLYIIDGVPTTRYEDFANLNTNSIASIQVLKDASASSIYGSRASNGVIIITTKDGSDPSGKEKIRIQLNSSLTIQTEKPWQEKVLNSEQRGEALWRAAVNDKTDPNNLVNKIYTYDWNGDYNNPVLNKVNIAPFVGGDPLEPVGNTNWQDAFFKKATITSNNLSISAGTARSGLVIDLGYYKNNGLIVFTNYEKYNARINTHTSAFNNRLKIGENLQLSRTSQVNSTTDVGGAPTPELALTLSPTIPLYKTDGTYGGPIGAGYTDRNNPVDMQYLNRWNTTKQVLLYGNVFADLEIINHLVFHTSLGFDYSDALAKRIAQIGTEGPVRSFNSLALQESKELTFTWTNTLNYNLVLGKHRLNLLAGTEAVRNDFQTFGAATTNFALQDVNYFQLGAGTGAQTNNGSATGYRLLSQFGKVFYGYSDKYLASFTIRRDGSSRFGTNNPYGIFPAATLGWRINNEEFFKNIDVVSNLKLRAGVGKVGNQEIGNLSAYTILQPNYGTSSSQFPLWLNTGTAYDINGVNTGSLPSGFVQVQRGNANLKWESTTETNIGLDFGFLHEKITGSFDYFSRKTSDILIQPPVAAALGEGQLQWVNGANKDNKGWEFVLSYHDNTSWGLGYSITGNASHWKDVITSLPDNVRPAYPGDLNHSIIGHSQFTIFGYKTDGIFQSKDDVDKHATQPGAGPGRIRYVDLNGDGKIDANDQEFLGTTLPKLEYGLRIEINYKDFDLSIFGSGVAGKTGFDPTKFFNSFVNVRNNFGPGTLSAWTPQNTGSKTPALTILNANGEDKPSDFYYVNASYFKLRNVMLGYNLPKNIYSRLKMEGLRIYVSGQNLFAIKSNQYTAKDPERVNAFGLWPVPTAVTFGLNANF
ncbi:MAG: TonB-dependent receptor [Bacteroidetes bacterium]|nr:MAG: TonB-dependent receptor [Bacteroidota bacterium]